MNAEIRSTSMPPTGELATDYRRELWVTWACITLTLIAWAGVTWNTGSVLWRHIHLENIAGCLEEAVFIAITQVLMYGAFVYQFTRIGYLKRRLAHEPLSQINSDALHDGAAPSLTILVPSYKEEIAVVRRTLLSAALQDYPIRRIVLLIDNPPQVHSPEDAEALAEARRLPATLQALFDSYAAPLFRTAQAYAARRVGDAADQKKEARCLAEAYESAAFAVSSLGRLWPSADHADEFFNTQVVEHLTLAHRHRAQDLLTLASTGGLLPARIAQEYRRLKSLFRVEFQSFERKTHQNLSHAANKAMNLNAYIGLMGQGWKRVVREDGWHLVPARSEAADVQIPDADFILTLDADSVLLPQYATVMVSHMLDQANARVAVAQTPYNTFPGAPNTLERIAGATTDIQYLIHQGLTHYDATYWVGANAVLRVSALRDIRTTVMERGHPMPVFIQDRTVIEDTESTIELVSRGWRLYNHPERLAFSATPPDFGSLIIQRARWANGGLLILPRLLRWLAAWPIRTKKLGIGFFRVHYLMSIAAVNVGLLILFAHDFENSITGLWLPASALPYFFLYARDLAYSGYRASDLAAVYALNLLLIPVNLAGVWKSLQQACTGRRTPFARTPKVSGRTAISGPFVVAQYALFLSMVAAGVFTAVRGHWASTGFCLANAAMLGWGLDSLIGWRASAEDLAAAGGRRRITGVSATMAAPVHSDVEPAQQRPVSALCAKPQAIGGRRSPAWSPTQPDSGI